MASFHYTNPSIGNCSVIGLMCVLFAAHVCQLGDPSPSSVSVIPQKIGNVIKDIT